MSIIQRNYPFIIFVMLVFNYGYVNAQEITYEEALKNYDYKKIYSLINSGVTQIPVSVQLETFKVLNKYDEAIDLLNSLIECDTIDVGNYLRLSEIYELKGNSKMAIHAYEEIRRLYPGNMYLISKHAALLYRYDKPQEAVCLLEQTFLVDTLQQNLRLLARCYEKLDSTQRAVCLYKKAIGRDSADHISVASISKLYLEIDSVDKVLKYTERYRQCDSTNLPVNRLNAQAYFKKADYKQSLSRYLKLVEEGDSLINTLYYLGLSYLYTDQMEKAYECFTYVNEKYKGLNPNVLGYLGIAASESYLTDEGIGYFNRALELLEPDDNQMYLLYNNLAKAHGKKQDNKMKINMLKEAYRFGKHPIILYNIAYTYDMLKEYGNARRYYKLYINDLDKATSFTGFELKMREAAEERLTYFIREDFFKGE